jgi:Ion channel
MRSGVDAEGTHRYGIVLLLVVVNVLFVAIAPATNLTRLIATAFSGATAIAAMRAAGAQMGPQRLVRLAVAIAIGGSAVALLTGGDSAARGTIALANAAFIILSPLVIFRGILNHVLDQGVDMHVVAGALAIYMMLGLFFAFVVSSVSEYATAAYFVQHSSASASDDVYFSFITLSTVGYGDYTPALGIGRGMSILEGVSGQLYLVTVVALLIGNLRGRRVHGRSVESESEPETG